jgi:hypothetical protein
MNICGAFLRCSVISCSKIKKEGIALFFVSMVAYCRGGKTPAPQA